MAGRKKTRKASGDAGWIDVSVPLREGMPCWPGDTAYRIAKQLDMRRGDVCNLSRVTMSAHAGTHMDAPLHFVRDGRPMEDWPADATVGPARVIAIRDGDCIKADELRPHRIRKGERLLFKTRNSSHAGRAGHAWHARPFMKKFVHIRCDAAQFLAQRQVRCVGVDYLSVGGFERDGVETHQALLGAGIWLIEGLDLSKIKPGRISLMCMPLKLVGAEGAPARALVRLRSG